VEPPTRLGSNASSSGSRKKSSGGSSSSKKKSSSSASSNHGAYIDADLVPVAAAPVTRKSSVGGRQVSSLKKKVGSTVERVAAAGESVADSLESRTSRVVRQRIVESSTGTSNSTVSDFSFDHPVATSASRYSPVSPAVCSGAGGVNAGNAKPLVALLPPLGVYAGLVGLVHVMVLFAFGRPELQAKLVSALTCLSFGLVEPIQIRVALELSDLHRVGLFTVVPLYIIAALLLRRGVRSVIGRGAPGACARAAALSANLARVVSALAFVLTVYAYTTFAGTNSYEGLNSLVVLEFAFMLQEFLLNFRRFSGARSAYSIAYLLVAGFLAWAAVQFEITAIPTPAAAPVLIVAVNYALLIVNTSDNLAASAGVWAGIGCNFCAAVCQALQSVTMYGLTPIMAVALFQKNSSLFPLTASAAHADAATGSLQPTFIESAAASFVMSALIFLLMVDSFLANITRTVSRAKAQ
jgi:hypothetical protein